MATRTRQMHEFLSGYLGPSSGPPSFGVPSKPLNARLPVRPGDGIPEGRRPIPTSSESSKRTNAQIPYVRHICSAPGTVGLYVAPKEGDIVLVERTTMLRKEGQSEARLGHGTNSCAYTRTIESLNENELKTPREEGAYTYDSFPYRLDGVINNVDSEDPQNEYRDYTIANVAIYGPCRLDHGEATRCDFKKTHPGSILYVGLEAIEKNGQVTHKLVRFSSAQLARGVHTLEDPPLPFPEPPGGRRTLVCVWVLGMLMDSNQSKNMVTVFVNVSTMRNIVKNDAEDYQKYTIKDKGEEKEKHVFNAVPFTVTQNDDGTETQTPAWSREVEIDIEDATVAAQLAGKWQGEQLKRLLPRSAAPPPDNDRPSASWY